MQTARKLHWKQVVWKSVGMVGCVALHFFNKSFQSRFTQELPQNHPSLSKSHESHGPESYCSSDNGADFRLYLSLSLGNNVT